MQVKKPPTQEQSSIAKRLFYYQRAKGASVRFFIKPALCFFNFRPGEVIKCHVTNSQSMLIIIPEVGHQR
jgi:hypothetical protein